ncbi:MAG: hypothetical protein GC201_05300 [Alphaproteobacteria bacterium]|nr:hypothetical protein [Alphaproteobacteria bacterium]
MEDLARLLQLFLSLSSAARPSTGIPWTRLPAGVFLGGLCFALLMTAGGFLLAAVYLWLEPVWGAGLAAFAVGMSLLPIAGLVGFAVYRMVTKPAEDGGGIDLVDLAEGAFRTVDAAEDWIARKPLTATGAALMAGMITALVLTRPGRSRR